MGWLFGQKLRYLRKRHQLTQVELAQRLQLASHAHVSNLEVGRFEPSLEVLVAVADQFAVQVEYLTREELPPEAAEESRYQAGSREPRGVQFFGLNLTRLRSASGLTQAHLAERLGLTSHAHISFLEGGRKQPSVELLLRIADLFGVTADQLLSANAP